MWLADTVDRIRYLVAFRHKRLFQFFSPGTSHCGGVLIGRNVAFSIDCLGRWIQPNGIGQHGMLSRPMSKQGIFSRKLISRQMILFIGWWKRGRGSCCMLPTYHYSPRIRRSMELFLGGDSKHLPVLVYGTTNSQTLA